ncbi:MAG: hypothetical protein QOC87_1908 [Actinomycetota bacterium]|jgi:hypothetical protein|nr:hypothetical protein [Actinomycetota bacterium]
MLKRLGSVALAVLVVATPAVAFAHKGGRTVSGQYNTIVISTDPGSPQANGSINNGVSFRPHKGERFISVVITDASGLPADAVVGQDLDGDGILDTSAEICGASTSPIAFEKGVRVDIWTQDGPCGDGTPAAATFGKIKATFTP